MLSHQSISVTLAMPRSGEPGADAERHQIAGGRWPAAVRPAMVDSSRWS